jgi:hypothetical protein
MQRITPLRSASLVKRTAVSAAKPANRRDGFAVRAGLIDKAERAMWVQGDGFAAFERVAPFIDEITRRYPRMRVVLSCNDAGTRGKLAAAFPEALVVPPPLPLAASALSALLRTGARLLVLLERPRCTPSLRRALRRTGIPAIVLDADGTVDDNAALPEHVLARSDAAAHAWRSAGLPPDRIRVLEGAGPRLSVPATSEAVELAVPLLARDLKLVRHERSTWQQRWLAFLGSAPGRALLGRRTRRIASITELGRLLAEPRTILCLGNGPSSEDPRVLELEYDALFRVNHSWKDRGILTRPDVVFTGSKKTVRAIPDTVFVFQNREAEARLLTDQLLHPGQPRLHYSTTDRLTDLVDRYDWGPLRPTNGATMLAVALALEPQRLVIAGIDLFADPAGSYPGDPSTPNAYTPGHSRESELGFLLTCLERYDGELIIVGNVLEAAWHEHCARRTSARG